MQDAFEEGRTDQKLFNWWYNLYSLLIVAYVKGERSKEEYNNIENAYMYEEGKMNYRLNRIQFIFFENLKQIFNTYNSFLIKLEKEKLQNLDELDKKIEELNKVW